MDIGSLLLIFALGVLVVLFVARPLFERTRLDDLTPAAAAEDQEHSALLAERDRILTAIQELDFDHTLGKIPAEEYPAQRARLLHHGAEILRRLDTLEAAYAPDRAGAPEAEAQLEAALAARRLVGGNGQPPAGSPAAVNAAASPSTVATAADAVDVAVDDAVDDDLEALLAQRRRSRREKSSGFCGQCGGPVLKSDRFCPKCGAKVV
jgi:hypothetical protein